MPSSLKKDISPLSSALLGFSQAICKPEDGPYSCRTRTSMCWRICAALRANYLACSRSAPVMGGQPGRYLIKDQALHNVATNANLGTPYPFRLNWFNLSLLSQSIRLAQKVGFHLGSQSIVTVLKNLSIGPVADLLPQQISMAKGLWQCMSTALARILN